MMRVFQQFFYPPPIFSPSSAQSPNLLYSVHTLAIIPVSMSATKIDFHKMRSWFFIGLIAILGIAVCYILRPFFYPLFWAAIIAVLFHPVFVSLNNRIKLPRVSSMLTVIIIMALVLLPLSLIVSVIVAESVALYQKIDGGELVMNFSGFSNWVENSTLGGYIKPLEQSWTEFAASTTQAVSTFFITNITAFTKNSIRFILLLFITLYTTYYLLKDGPAFLRRVVHLSPLGDEYDQVLFNRFVSTTRATLKGTLIVGMVQGMIGSILFWFTGVQGAIIWGVIMTAASVIPGVGPSIIWLPVAIVMLATGQIWQGITIIAVGAIVIGLIDNLLRPILVGRDIQMHPLLVFFSTLGGIILFGISGFVIGPIIVGLFLSVMSMYDYYYERELEHNKAKGI